MKTMRFQDRKGRSSIFGRTIGTVAISLVMLLAWLAADPEAHEHFHHDAAHEDHHCAITDFALGEGFYLPPAIGVRPAVATVEPVAVEAEDTPREPVHYALLPSCGPPFNGLSA